MAKNALVIADLSGGRNGYDSPINLPEDQCVEALNVDWFEGSLANKRGGSTALGTSFSDGSAFIGTVAQVLRHVPGADETAAELWAADTGTTSGPCRLAASTLWTRPAISDNASSASDWYNMAGASLNGMLTICYKSGQNRLHVWDPSLSKIRRVGLATPATPTTTAGAAGALSFTRYYRIRWVDISGSDTRRRSEASAATTAQTIAAKDKLTVNRPTAASEDETHWEVIASDAATGPWYVLSQVAAATTTYADTNATIPTTTLDVEDGINFPPPAAKYIVTDGNRLIMGGCHETSGGYVTPKNTRVWWTPVLGSNDIGDSERIPSGNFRDVEEAITGISYPVQGSFYAFSYRSIWKFVPTGVDTAPYQVFTISRSVGCIRHQSIVTAEDENGNPAVYFTSAKGPCRIGSSGVQYIGSDVEDVWATANLGAATVSCFTVPHAAKHQVWFFVATGSSDTPDTRLVFDTRLGKTVSGDAVRKGWAKHMPASGSFTCGVPFSNTLGATMSRDLKPHVGRFAVTGGIWKSDSSATDDAGTAFQAYVQTKEYAPAGLGKNVTLYEPSLIAQVASGVTITVTGRQDFGLRSDATGTCLLTASGSETHVQKKAEGFQSSELGSIAFRIGDASAVSNQWTLDALYAPYAEGAQR